MRYLDENNNQILEENVWKYENIGSDIDTVYLKTPSINWLRVLRDKYCFSVINRGQIWYDTLTEEQKEELKEWYRQWLKVTETKTIPETPIWLK